MRTFDLLDEATGAFVIRCTFGKWMRVMNDLGALVGLVSGLISIFTFFTGVNSLRVIRAEANTAGAEPQWSGPRVYVRSRLLVGLVFAVFLGSLGVTLTMGLAGGDVAGALFVLLLFAGVSVTVFVLRFAYTVSPLSFGITSTAFLTAAGFAIGTISRGEEAVNSVAGLFIGLGVTVIAWLFRPADEAARAPAPVPSMPSDRKGANADAERTVLEIAAKHAGEVTVASIALESELTLDDARTCLEGLHDRGFCERSRTEHGATLYRFPDLVR